MTTGMGIFLGISDFGDKNQYHSLHILDGLNSLSFFLSQDMYSNLLKLQLEKMDVIQLAYDIVPQTINVNGKNSTVNTVRLVGFAKPNETKANK